MNLVIKMSNKTLEDQYDFDDAPINQDQHNSGGGQDDRKDADIVSVTRSDLKSSTNHLKGFRNVERGLKLVGDEYEVIRKLIWYILHSMPVRRSKAELGDVSSDCRVHAAFIMPPGSGKKRIVKILEKTLEDDYDVAKPTSLHEEQLIGKTEEFKKDGETMFEERRGHLDDDILIKDEATNLFSEQNRSIKDARAYINEALDEYGSKRVEKRATGKSKEESVSFMPDCNLVLLLHPFKMNQRFAMEGTLRRFLNPYTNLSQEPDFEAYEKRIRPNAQISREQAIQNLKSQLREIEERHQDSIEVRSDAVQRFIELHKQLVIQGFGHSEKGRNLTRIMDYPLQDYLLKFSAIQAFASNHDEIYEEDVEKAFIDIIELWVCMLNYVNQKIRGSLDYGEIWNGATGRDREILEELQEREAFSKEESAVTIREIHEFIQNEYDVSQKTARNYTSKYKEKGWIGKQQVGNNDSVIWLKVGPEGGKGGRMETFIEQTDLKSTEYFGLVEKYQ